MSHRKLDRLSPSAAVSHSIAAASAPSRPANQPSFMACLFAALAAALVAAAFLAASDRLAEVARYFLTAFSTSRWVWVPTKDRPWFAPPQPQEQLGPMAPMQEAAQMSAVGAATRRSRVTGLAHSGQFSLTVRPVASVSTAMGRLQGWQTPRKRLVRVRSMT